MEEGIETIILELEGTKVECDKNLLINNSDYFSAMFTGSFKESTLKTVKIQDVDLKSFNTIQILIKDADHVIEEQELLLILHAACILQFGTIKKLCIERIEELLKPCNCLHVWKTSELLDLSPLWIKAKCMALTDFDNIKDINQLFEFSIDDICSYLGNMYLYVRNEFSVFQIAMNWWYENQKSYEGEETKTILRLLNCIDFKTLTSNEITEMQTYPDISNNTHIVSTLKCVSELLVSSSGDESSYSSDQLQHAKHLYNSEGRKMLEVPCVLVQDEGPELNSSDEDVSDDAQSKSVGNYWKKKKCKFMQNAIECATTGSRAALIYESISDDFKTYFEIEKAKTKDLAGFKLCSYKEFVFLFGGEYTIGGGNWNLGLWIYDTFKEKWQRRTVLPEGRRHFETATIDGCVFIVGGAGKFRVIQHNIMWYDFEADKWSKVVALPCSTRDLKCCSFNGQLFVVYLVQKKGYFFDKNSNRWRKIKIQLEKDVIKSLKEYAVFSHSNNFYIKGNWNLLQLSLEGDQFILVKTLSKGMKFICSTIEEIECTVVNNTLYSLYTCFDQCCQTLYTLEAVDLKTNVARLIFEEMDSEQDHIFYENRMFLFGHSPRLFSVLYYYFVKDNVCLKNDVFK